MDAELRRSSLLALLGALAILLPCPAAGVQAGGYGAWYEGLRGLEPDPARGATVQNLMVLREGATLLLENGTLQLLRPVEGRTVGAVWVGEGRFVMGAPSEVERAQLRRSYGADRLDQRIRRAVLFFTEDPEVLFPTVTWGPQEPPGNGRREVEEALRYVSDDDGWMHRDVAVPLLNSVPGFLYVHVADGRGDPAILMTTPLGAEGVSLAKRAEGAQVRETVVQYPRQADVQSGRTRSQEELDPVRVTHYDFAGTIRSNLDFEAVATLTLERGAEGHDWVPLTLHPDLDIDSIRWADGGAVTFARPEDSGDLWIDFSEAASDDTSLSVFYRGDLFDRFLNSWVEMKSSTGWLPRYASGRPATYRMTFRHHESYRIAAVGTRVSESEPDAEDMVTVVWETSAVRWATFNVGRFTEHTVAGGGLELTVQLDEGAHRSLSQSFSQQNQLIGQRCPTCSILPRRQSDMGERVSRDLLNSFSFFEEVFGSTERQRFVATEIPYNHGEAHAGLVLLSWSTFHWTTEEGYDEIFRAHEVAHQWWGIGVRPATYHDRWLAEGFAQFSGLWYMGRVRGSLELLTDHLERAREDIWDRREEAGPIWLGTRLATREAPEDYSLIVYDKGAWVLHMLRVMLTDPDTGSDAAFEAMIKEFFSTYRGRAASTEQFLEVVEKHAGIAMGWFFEQWVYGTAIPRYHFSYRSEELPGGEVRMTVRVRQEGVPDSFQMIVPVFLDFGMAGSAQVNIAVTGPETVTELPVLPLEPLEVVFNPFESVLAEVETEGWRD